MTFTSAVLALSWIAIILLGFGFAALLQQVRSLQAAMRLPAAARVGPPDSGRPLAPVVADRRYVLTVDPGCAYCHEIAPRFRDLAVRHASVADFAVLTADADFAAKLADGGQYDAAGVALVVDAEAYRDLAPSYSPGLLVIGLGGALLDVAPGGDLKALEKVLRRATRPSTTTSNSTSEVVP